MKYYFDTNQEKVAKYIGNSTVMKNEKFQFIHYSYQSEISVLNSVSHPTAIELMGCNLPCGYMTGNI